MTPSQQARYDSLSSGQRLMVDDGMPIDLMLSQEERLAAWVANPPKTATTFYDPRIEADRQMREQEKKAKAAIRIKKLKASLERKKQMSISTKGLRWDTNYSRWIPDSDSTQEDEMPKLVITPYDATGLAVKRGLTSAKEDATPDLLEKQIIQAFRRGGVTRVIRVEVTKDGQVVSNHTIEEFGHKLATAAPEAEPGADAQPAPEGPTEEADMAKRKTKKAPKAKKPAKVKKAPGNGGLRAGSKQEMLYNMLTRKSGCTTDEAIKATGWKSCGVATWGKKFGLKVTKEKSASGVTRYYGA